jgi:hypothetical protein
MTSDRHIGPGLRTLLVAALAMLLAGCAGIEQFGAAGDVHALLIAIRDDDKAGFDAHVDRPALERQLRERLRAEAAKRTGHDPFAAALGAMLADAITDVAAGPLIQPGVFLAVAETLGYSPNQPIPDRLVIARSLRRIDDAHVCVATKQAGPCLLTFQNEDNSWRLVGFEGGLDMLLSKHR